MSGKPGLLEAAVANGTLRRSLVTSIVVGTILTTINHGDFILAGDDLNYVKIGLNYLVPYLVATYGAVSAKYALWRAEQSLGESGRSP